MNEGEKKLWKGKNATYEVSWCSLCQVFSIQKEGGCQCHGSSCNATGCPKCLKDFDLFRQGKYRLTQYLSEKEFIIYQKVIKLQNFMLNSLSAGEKSINWKNLVERGEFSRNDKQTFKKFLNKKWKYEPK